MADYAFYMTQYGGTLPEQDFSRLHGRAAAKLENLTLGRSRFQISAPVRHSVDMALCAMVDVLDKYEQGGEVSSESNDGISRTYATGTPKTLERQLSTAASEYLAWTGLLYRGCCF